MRIYKRRLSAAEGMKILREFAQTIEIGHFQDHAAVMSFADVGHEVVGLVDRIDGRRRLSKLDFAWAVSRLATATPETWREALREVGAQARKLEKQLGAAVKKKDRLLYESIMLEQ